MEDLRLEFEVALGDQELAATPEAEMPVTDEADTIMETPAATQAAIQADNTEEVVFATAYIEDPENTPANVPSAALVAQPVAITVLPLNDRPSYTSISVESTQPQPLLNEEQGPMEPPTEGEVGLAEAAEANTSVEAIEPTSEPETQTDGGDLPPSPPGDEPPVGGSGSDAGGEESPEDDEFANAPALIKDSVAELTESLPLVPAYKRHGAVRELACALAIADGPEEGHRFAQDQIDALRLTPQQSFSVWEGLYAEGDEAALPKAEHAMTLAAAEAEEEVREDWTADHTVSLVEAGHRDAVNAARSRAQSASQSVRTELLVRLYRAGDELAADVAIRDAAKVKELGSRAESEALENTQHGLFQMAEHAAERGNEGDALLIAGHLNSPEHKAHVHAELYRTGHEDSLQQALAYLERKPLTEEDMYEHRAVERRLAKGGYEPALEAIRQRAYTPSQEASPREEATQRVADLLALHASGDPSAADELVSLVRTQELLSLAIDDILNNLVTVGKADAAYDILATRRAELQLTEQGGEEFVKELAAVEEMLSLRHDDAQWRQAFYEYRARRPLNLDYPVRLVGDLARQVKQCRETGR